MGCFNAIGFVSNLPIVYGDKTTLIFMYNQHEFFNNKLSSVINSNDLFKPMFLPIQGEYNDYGVIENIIETPIVKYIESFFGLTIGEIIEKVADNSVGRGDVTTSPKNPDIFKYLTFGLELTEVYDTMSKMTNPNVNNWGGGTSTNMEVISDATRGIRLNGTSSNLYDGLSSSMDIRFAELMMGNLEDPIEIEKHKVRIEKMKNDTPIDKLGMTGVDEQSFMDFISFTYLISELNHNYFPSNYGSQEQSYVKHYELLSKYLNIVTSKINSDIYDNGSDCEDYDGLKSRIREEKIDIIFDPIYEE